MPPTSLPLAGRVAIVTGAGRGLGAAVATSFARAGARVAVCARHAAEIEGVADAIRRAGGEAIAVTCDVRREADVERLVAETVRAFGRLDVVVNNAGVFAHAARWPRASEKAWDEAMDTNVKGAWLVAKHATAVIAEGGVVINVTSGLARGPSPAYAPYSVSKAALEALTKSIAAALPHVRVNALNPGVVRTDMSNGLGLPPEVVAPAFVWLASDEAKGITGQVLHADELRRRSASAPRAAA